MIPSKYTLGVDMGVASIGWAVVSTEDSFIDSGVRIFPAGLDNFNSSKEKHPNLDRRGARGMRRRIRRKADRKALIKEILKDLGWLPSNDKELDQWHKLDVYELRSRAISEKISLRELARIILHLNQRRGFLSLRKTEESDADKDTQGMLGEITELQKSIDESGAKTLGNYLYQIYQKDDISIRLRNRHTRRSMLHYEFSLIWETQSKFNPELTDKLRYGSTGRLEKPIKVVTPIPRVKEASLLEQFGIENLSFFQRRVYWPENSIGQCELEGPILAEELLKKSCDKKVAKELQSKIRRAPIADRRFQEFRLLQEVNNLRILDNSVARRPEERPLTSQEREIVIDYLTGKKEVKFEALKKYLCKHKELKATLPSSPSQLTFNLESGGRTKISTTPTDAHLVSTKGLGKEWNDLTNDTKNLVIEALTRPAAIDEDIRADLEKIHDISSDHIERLLKVSLPAGYGHISIKALEKLLPHLRKGMLYMAKDTNDSALHAAGYKRRDEQHSDALDLLPTFQALVDPNSKFYDPHQVIINNPVVLRALTELRKVVNGLIRKYGKPAQIHVEMARELKMSPKARSEHQKKTRQFEKERDSARKAIEELNVIPNRDAINLYRLWKEQGELCIYSGKTISLFQLFNSEVDVDHIYPFSNSADDSFTNKVVCFAQENRDKGNRIPYTWLSHSDPEKYEAMLQRAKKLMGGKYKRFIATEIPDGFVNRDLNDTAWMAKAANHYLARLFDKPHHVLGIKGAHTAKLRDQWELHSLLRSDGLDLKNRDDHRHHALDAIVIALCDRERIAELTKKLLFETRIKEAKQEGKRIYHLRTSGDKLVIPWQNFRLDTAESLNSIWVSHRPKRKISGALHKETNYGKDYKGDLVVRKRVQDLTAKELAGICDPTLQSIIQTHIREMGGNIKALKEISDDSPLTMPSGIAIRKVRTARPYAHITIRKGTPHETHVQSAATHHLAIFTLGDGKFHFEPVTLYEASRRLRAKEEVIQKVYPNMPAEAEFLFHLCSRDSMMATIDGTDQLFVFNTMATSTGQVKFAYHTDAAQAHKHPETGVSLLRTCTPGSFEKNFPNARKVNILPTGEPRNVS